MSDITVEAFYCPTDDAIVRGHDAQSSPGPDNSVLVTATCILCGKKVYKTIYPAEGAAPPPPATPPAPAPSVVPEPELVKQVEGTQFLTPGTDAYVGTPERPSSTFWDAYVKAITLKLPPSMIPNIPKVASISWYTYLSDDQRQSFLDRFKETGVLEVPDDSFDITRANPKDDRASAMSGTDKSAAALKEVSEFARMVDSPELTGLAVRFWSAKEYDGDYGGLHLLIRLVDWEHSPYEAGIEAASRSKSEILDVRASVGAVPVVTLSCLWNSKDKKEEPWIGRPGQYVKVPPAMFRLTLYDAGYYSHPNYRSFVKSPSLVLAAAIEKILMSAPVDIGHISFKDDTISFHASGKRRVEWLDAKQHEILIPRKDFPKDFVKPFWKFPVVESVEVEEVTVDETELERLQAKVDAKEDKFNEYIEKLYDGDIELAKKLNLSPVEVAKLMGDTEYLELLKQMDELMAEQDAALVPKKQS